MQRIDKDSMQRMRFPDAELTATMQIRRSADQESPGGTVRSSQQLQSGLIINKHTER